MHMSRYTAGIRPDKRRVLGSRKLLLIAGAAIGIVVVWMLIFRGASNSSPVGEASTEKGRETAALVTLSAVRLVETPRWTVTTGTVRPQLEAEIATRVTGRVLAVLLREGDRVTRGQPLIRLDARDTDASIAQAEANVRAAQVGVATARVSAQMEDARSFARIAEARAGVAQAGTAVQNARARLDLVKSGPRKQERAQASLATLQAKSNFQFAETELRRMENLVNEGVISRQKFDGVKNQHEIAKAQYEAAQQAENITQEGSRDEDIRSAEHGLRQTEASLEQARAGLSQAEAAALEVKVRRQQIQSARAQLGQSAAALRSAQVARDYTVIAAPFDGVVAARLVDPGSLAAPGIPLLKIQGREMRLQVIVPESVLGAAKVGSLVALQLDAINARSLTGRVAEVSPQGDAASHTFVVKVELSENAAVKAGMFGRAYFRTGTDRKLFIPTEAVFERDGLAYAMVADSDERARLRMITVGGPEGKQTPVLSGLREGEKVIVNGRAGVVEGARVREQ